MPYVFPYENLFVAGVSVLILALLVVRVVLRRRQQEQERLLKRTSQPSESSHREPMV